MPELLNAEMILIAKAEVAVDCQQIHGFSDDKLEGKNCIGTIYWIKHFRKDGKVVLKWKAFAKVEDCPEMHKTMLMKIGYFRAELLAEALNDRIRFNENRGP